MPKKTQEKSLISPDNSPLENAAAKYGINEDKVMKSLSELLDGDNDLKVDKNGNVVSYKNGKVTLAAIQTISKLMGYGSPKETTESAKFLDKMGEKKLIELSRKVKKS